MTGALLSLAGPLVALVQANAHAADVASGGPLTLVLPLLLVFLVAGWWYLALRRGR